MLSEACGSSLCQYRHSGPRLLTLRRSNLSVVFLCVFAVFVSYMVVCFSEINYSQMDFWFHRLFFLNHTGGLGAKKVR